MRSFGKRIQNCIRDGQLQLDVLGEVPAVFADDIAGGPVLAHEVLAATALSVVTTDLSGSLPDELGEVTGGQLEAWSGRVVLVLLLIPSGDSGNDISVTEGKVLTIWTTRVMHGAVLGLITGEVGHLLAPGEWLSTVSSPELVVGLEALLVIANRGWSNWSWSWSWDNNWDRRWRWLWSWSWSWRWLWGWSRGVVDWWLVGWSLNWWWFDIDDRGHLWLGSSVLCLCLWGGTFRNINGLGDGQVNILDGSVLVDLASAFLNRIGEGAGSEHSDGEDDRTHFDGCEGLIGC